MNCGLPSPSVHGDSPGKNIWMDCPALLQGIFPTQGSNPGLLHCRQILYHLSNQGSKRKNSGVGNHSLLQGIFLIQESNWGLLHCRQILYQLSYQGMQLKANIFEAEPSIPFLKNFLFVLGIADEQYCDSWILFSFALMLWGFPCGSDGKTKVLNTQNLITF